MIPPIFDEELYRDSIATVDNKGKRVWIYPKQVNGIFYKWRTYVSWVLLAFLFGMPFIKIDGDPILLFNVLERRFIIFGINFAPQDFHLFVLAMLIMMVFIALFTAVFGRIFCGWVCPQTIFLEMVYRKIEYWIEGDASAQRKLNLSPWTTEKIIKKTIKQIIFFVIAVLVANTFLSYIIGADAVIKIATEPVAKNWQGFTAMIVFSGAFYFVFAWLREQVCTTICPYGRMQGVLLDKSSIVVHYDHVRGEPRGKIKREPTLPEPVLAFQQSLGDCVDCHLCVRVCPTGIDIRNGTQLECVNCTACMDACDDIMEKVGRKKGLIRYDSYNGIVEGRKKIFTPRVWAYSSVLLVLIVIEGFLLSSRTDVETLLLRTPGILFQQIDEQHVSNLYNYQIINKTKETLPIEFRLVSDSGNIKLIGNPPVAKPTGVTEGALFVEMPIQVLHGRSNTIVVEVYSNGKLIETVETNFFGPIQ